MTVFILIVLVGGGAYFYLRNKPGKHDSASADWITDFIVYHVAALFQAAPSGKMPDGVVGLIRGELPGALEFELLGSMQNYTAYRYNRSSSVSDIPAVRQEAEAFLGQELRTLNSANAARRFIRRMHKLDTVQEMTDADLEAQFNEISADIKVDDDKARAFRAMLLRDWMEEDFQRRHGKPVRQFLEEMVAAQS